MEKYEPSSKFKALVFHKTEDIRYEDITYDFDNLDEDYVVIKVRTAGLGPYELGFVIGRLTPPTDMPTNLGIEGCGDVVKVGNNCDSSLVGKRVAFLSVISDKKAIRSFSEYSVVNKDSILILPDSVDDNQGAYILANPVTAICLFNSVIAREDKKHGAIIQDTSSSSLGKMITKLCKKNNIKIINIVRRDENIKMLDEIGSTYTLNSNASTFIDDLSKAINELQPLLYITYMAGSFPSQVLDQMPNNSTLCSCGNINNQLLSGFSSTEFIFKGKNLTGFQVLLYLNEISSEEKSNIYSSIISQLTNGDDTYYSEIVKEFQFSDWDEARKFYESNMSRGKIILKP